MLQTANIADLLDVRFREVFWKQYNKVDTTYQEYMGIINSDRNYEMFSGFYDTTTFPKLAENETVHVSKMAPDYNMTFTPDQYSDSQTVSKIAIDDDQFRVVEQKAKQLARGAKIKLNESCAEILKYGFGITDSAGESMLAKDGKRHFSTTHYKNQDETGTTYSNADGSGRILSEENLEVLKQQLRLMKGPDGKLMYLKPDTLITSTYNEKTAKILLGSQLRPDTANNDMNVYYGSGMKLIVLPELDETSTYDDYWFVADSDKLKEPGFSAVLVMREMPNFSKNSPIYHDRNRYWEWVMDMRFARGMYEPRPIVGSKGDGASYTD